jgi:predicted DNA-binding transcriptional regulator YafY
MRADRLLSMMLLLQTRGKMTASALADELGVSRRTVLRDVEALSFSGIPIYADGGHGGGIALDENYRTTLTHLKESEVRALFITSNNQLLNEIGLGEAAESTLLKLSAALPDRHQPSVEHIRQRIYIDPLWWWHDAEIQPFWTELQQAVYEDRCIQVVYEHYNGEIVERQLEPYSLVAKSSTWYLIACRDGERRTYRVSRFREIRLLTEHFQRDPDFDLPTYWHEHLSEFVTAFSDYEFTLRVHPERVKFAQWLTPGRNTVVAAHGDGWMTLRFRVESAELAKMMVFGLGRQCEVLEPQSLKDAVITACQDLLDHLRQS